MPNFGVATIETGASTEPPSPPTPDTILGAYREKTISIFKEKGYLRQDTDGTYIVDVDKFRNIYWKDFKNTFNNMRRSFTPLQASIIKPGGLFALANAFADQKVYSEEDYAKKQQDKEVEPIPLFYTPQDQASALDVEKIKREKFYMGLWEVGETRVLPASYPTKENGMQSTLSTHEAITACLIYHPKYGDGKRVEGPNGRLMVNFRSPDNNTTERNPISYKFFSSWNYTGAPDMHTVQIDKRPAEFFMRRCPNMVEKGLIDPWRDFAINKGSATYEQMGSGVRRMSNRGTIQLEGFHYYLGLDYAGNKGYSVYKISNKLAGIVKEEKDGTLRLEKVMKLHSPFPDQIAKLQQDPQHNYVNRKFIDMYSPEEYGEQSPESKSIVDNFQSYLHLAKRISQDPEAAFSISNLSVKEQGFAASLYREYGTDPRFWSFIRQHKLDGLRVLMVAQGSFGDAEKIWKVSEHMRPAIFSDVAQVLSKTTAYRDTVRATLSEDDKVYGDELTDVIVDHTGKLLLSATEVIEGNTKLDISDVEFAIRSFREKIDRVYAERYGIRTGEDAYQQLLNVYTNSPDNPNIRALVLSKMEQLWQEQMTADDQRRIKEVDAATRSFYAGNEELYKTVGETTGDTEKHRANFLQYALAREAQGVPISGPILDMGCGEVGRMTDFIAKSLPHSTVVGIDMEQQTLRQAAQKEHERNVRLAAGNFAKIPVADNSMSLVTANWSVLNDLLLTKLQFDSLSEVARVLKPEGELYFDVPSLEGEGQNYLPWAEKYHADHPQEPFGMIEREFPGERIKKFFIYPKSDLEAKLERVGFEITSWKPWIAESGLARQTVVARLKSKITPASLAA